MSSGKIEAAHTDIFPRQASAGNWIFRLGSAIFVAVAALQICGALGVVPVSFGNWQPTMFAFLLWGVALAASQVLKHGESGKQTLFVLPALLFTSAMVIFPTIFGLYIAFTDWNLNAQSGHHFNGLDNLRTLWGDSYFWNALGNMVFYVLTVLAQYVIAFGLATIVFALSQTIWLSILALAAMGAADAISVVIRVSLVQLATPDAMRGRVGAVNFLFINASNQLGQFESGITAALMGTVPAAMFGGVATVAVALLWMKLFPTLRHVEKLE